MTNGWTSERRERQSEMIKHWKPWERSTGPKSRAGKSRVARNAFKGGTRPLLRELARSMKEQSSALRRIEKQTGAVKEQAKS